MQFESEAPTATTNRVCVTAKICDSMTEYQTAPLTATTNRVCVTAKICDSMNEYQTDDRQCATALTCTDATNCFSVGSLYIISTTATSLVNPVLTRAEGYLWISDNDMLTRVDFASLSYVGGELRILYNSALTFASLPRLSQVQREIIFCRNAPTFVIPNPDSGTAAPPGLTSVQHKGTANCFLQNGSASCITAVTCP